MEEGLFFRRRFRMLASVPSERRYIAQMVSRRLERWLQASRPSGSTYEAAAEDGVDVNGRSGTATSSKRGKDSSSS